MKVIVTGSRNYTERDRLWKVLDGILAAHPDLFIAVGDCPTGADKQAREWAWERFSGPEGWRRIFQYRADWTLGRRAGPLRNAAMVAAGADECHAFYAPDGNTGTADCVRRAQRAGIRVIEHWTISLSMAVEP